MVDSRRYSSDAWQRALGEQADRNRRENSSGNANTRGGSGIGLAVLACAVFYSFSNNDNNKTVQPNIDTKRSLASDKKDFYLPPITGGGATTYTATRIYKNVDLPLVRVAGESLVNTTPDIDYPALAVGFHVSSNDKPFGKGYKVTQNATFAYGITSGSARFHLIARTESSKALEILPASTPGCFMHYQEDKGMMSSFKYSSRALSVEAFCSNVLPNADADDISLCVSHTRKICNYNM